MKDLIRNELELKILLYLDELGLIQINPEDRINSYYAH